MIFISLGALFCALLALVLVVVFLPGKIDRRIDALWDALHSRDTQHRSRFRALERAHATNATSLDFLNACRHDHRADIDAARAELEQLRCELYLAKKKP